MASNQKQTRQLQLERFEQQLSAHMAALEEKGLDEKARKKDRAAQHLTAQIQRTKKALAGIASRETIIAKAKEQKIKNAEQKKSRGPKSKAAKQAGDAPKKDKKEKKGKKKEKQS